MEILFPVYGEIEKFLSSTWNSMLQIAMFCKPRTNVTFQVRDICHSIELLEWARKNGYCWNGATCALVAHTGHIDVLQWLKRNGCMWDKRTCTHAALGGNLPLSEWEDIMEYRKYYRANLLWIFEDDNKLPYFQRKF